jgi:hypothetical protein
MPATARGQLAVGRTPRQGNFDDPRTRKLVGWSPPAASAQLRTGIAVQCRPSWMPVVVRVGGQLGGQPWGRRTGNATWSGTQPCVTRAAGWVVGSDRHRTQVRHEHTQVTRSLPWASGVTRCCLSAQVMAGCVAVVRHGGFAVLCSSWAFGRRGTDYVAGPLKRPNRTMAGTFGRSA